MADHTLPGLPAGRNPLAADDYERDLLDAWDAPVEMQSASDGHETGIHSEGRSS